MDLTALRIGNGFDFHALSSSKLGSKDKLESDATANLGTGFMLGGVHIDADFQVVAHSDGDVIAHSLIDALLGAMAMGDIGILFPETEDRFRNASGKELMLETLKYIQGSLQQILQVDITLFLAAPKLAPYRSLIISELGTWLDLNPNQIGLKAKSMNDLGSLGQGQAVGAHTAVMCLRTGL